MGNALTLVALALPVVGGALNWPWWIILVAGILGFVGFFTSRAVVVEGHGGVPRVVISAILLNVAIGAVLFEIGHLLRHL